MKVDIHKVSLSEMINDSKGRSSPSKFLGLLGGIISILVFLLCGISILTKYQDGTNIQSIAMQSVAMLTVCATLLGIRRFTKDKEIEEEK
jgi:hypothetical protein